jgi:hypothetical protein
MAVFEPQAFSSLVAQVKGIMPCRQVFI